VQSYPGLLAAIVSLGLLLLVVGVSVTIARRHLAYETWYFVHLYTLPRDRAGLHPPAADRG